jgi:hypothetical protein
MGRNTTCSRIRRSWLRSTSKSKWSSGLKGYSHHSIGMHPSPLFLTDLSVHQSLQTGGVTRGFIDVQDKHTTTATSDCLPRPGYQPTYTPTDPYTNINKLKPLTFGLFKFHHRPPRPFVSGKRTPMYPYTGLGSEVVMNKNCVFGGWMDMTSKGCMVQSDMDKLFNEWQTSSSGNGQEG